MTNTLDPKGLEAGARAAYEARIGDGTNYYVWDDPCFYAEYPDVVDGIREEAEAAVTAYLAATVPADALFVHISPMHSDEPAWGAAVRAEASRAVGSTVNVRIPTGPADVAALVERLGSEDQTPKPESASDDLVAVERFGLMWDDFQGSCRFDSKPDGDYVRHFDLLARLEAEKAARKKAEAERDEAISAADPDFWDQQMHLRDVITERDRLAAVVAAAEGRFIPSFLPRDEGRLTEFVIRDVPHFVGPAVSVYAIMDTETRELIGFQWHTHYVETMVSAAARAWQEKHGEAG